MKAILKFEQAGIFLLSIFLFYQYVGYSLWWYLILFLFPDISALGYLVGNKTGAITYNIFHHQGIAALIIVASVTYKSPICLCAGLILLGHAAFDRIWGYGLKLNQGFSYTHLGRIGKNK